MCNSVKRIYFMKKVIIIGAGPAGLAAADKLCENGINPVVLEKDSCVGGLSRTIKYNGHYFDIGPHRFFTKNSSVFNWWQDTLRNDFIKMGRHTRIYYKGKFFNYPLSIGNVLSNLGILNFFPIFFSYLKSRFLPSRNEESFQDWVINRFGNRVYQLFFKDYTEKIWGIPCNQISADWAAQRIKGLSLSSTVRNTIFRDKKNKIKTLIREFHYPRRGCGMMYEAVANRVIQRGGEIKLNSEVMEIKHNHNRLTGLVYKNTRDGSLSEIEGTDFCSGMPLNLLVLRMNPLAGKQILEACNRLKYRSLLMVYLIIGKRDLFKDNWLYIHSGEVKVGRIQNYKNWSADMVADPQNTTLGLEYFCAEGDSFWNQADKTTIDLAARELEQLKIAHINDILGAFVLRIPYAYPVYERKYDEALGIIKDFLGRFSNLQCIGRTGMFRYNNMDHSILSGFLAAQNLCGANHNIWNINLEHSYHEELEENNSTSLQ